MTKTLIFWFGDISFSLWGQTQIWYFFIFAKLQKYTIFFKIHQVLVSFDRIFKSLSDYNII